MAQSSSETGTGSAKRPKVEWTLWALLGVLGIGFLNFFVSFSLAFFVAVKSRGIRLRDYPEFLSLLGRYFIRHPRHFIWPPKE